MFADRNDAATRLADALADAAPENPVVLALPRGGVPVAVPVARRLNAPLDLLLVRKIGTPGNPELACGAMVDGDPPAIVWNTGILRHLNLSPDDFDAAIAQKKQEIAARRKAYLKGRPPVDLSGRTAIVVDDGIATGATVKAALAGLRQRRPAAIWLAVPVASAESIAELTPQVDRLICLETPRPFVAVGQHYRRFEQVPDDTVTALMAETGNGKT